MKTAQEWFKEYAVSHQNSTNQIIHYVCVPLIFFSVIGLLMSIPSSIIENTLELYNPLLENWAVFTSVFILIFCSNAILYFFGNYWELLVGIYF
jgi:uncharacterized membrane protein YGL010W